MHYLMCMMVQYYLAAAEFETQLSLNCSCAWRQCGVTVQNCEDVYSIMCIDGACLCLVF